ncbi:MAG: BREX system P-loop protein BrxC, partial [Peptostreptococcaceae bacterium]
IEDIVNSNTPYISIPKLPKLVEEFSNRFTELLEVEYKPIRRIIEGDYKQVLDELSIYGVKDELGEKFKNRFDDIINRLDRVNNFYEAIAMKEESDRLKTRSINEIYREVDAERKTKSLSILSIVNGTKTIKSREDIEGLLENIRKTLNEELEENTIINLV